MGYFKYPIKRPDSAKNNFSVFKIVNFKNTENLFEQISDQNYFGNVHVRYTEQVFSSQIFLHDEKTSENLSFICRLCQARQIAETKI